MHTALKFLYTLSIGLWVGSIFFFAFFAAPSIFKVLPKESAGNVVSDIFPKYYMIAYICGGAALIFSLLMRHFEHKQGGMHTISIILLVVMLSLAVLAGKVISPKTVETRTQLRNMSESSPEYPALQKKFSALHTNSAMANGAIFILGIAITFINAYTIRE